MLRRARPVQQRGERTPARPRLRQRVHHRQHIPQVHLHIPHPRPAHRQQVQPLTHASRVEDLLRPRRRLTLRALMAAGAQLRRDRRAQRRLAIERLTPARLRAQRLLAKPKHPRAAVSCERGGRAPDRRPRIARHHQHVGLTQRRGRRLTPRRAHATRLMTLPARVIGDLRRITARQHLPHDGPRDLRHARH